MKFLLSSVLIAPLLAAAVTAAPAAAAPVTARVHYGDLDLATAKGKAKFDRRVRVALNRVCGALDRTALNEIASIAECRRETARAVAAKIAPVLAAHQDRAAVRGTR